jgi:hypothetical protein
MLALRHPHDRDRGVRARLPAEAAADAEQVRHHEPYFLRAAAFPSLCAGSTLAAISLSPTSCNQCARRPLIPFKRRWRRFFRSLARPRAQECRPPRPRIELGANIKPHSARRPAAYPTSHDFVPRRFLDAGSPSVRRVSSPPASKNLYNSSPSSPVFGTRQLDPARETKTSETNARKERSRDDRTNLHSHQPPETDLPPRLIAGIDCICRVTFDGKF